MLTARAARSVVLALAVSACAGGADPAGPEPEGQGDSPSSPSGRTASGGQLALGGRWVGRVERLSGGETLIEWNAVQAGQSLSGAVMLHGAGLSFSGAMTGSLSGAAPPAVLTLSIVVPPGGVPGLPACRISSVQAVTAEQVSNDRIESLAFTFSHTSCAGLVEDAQVDYTARLILTRP